jgi:phage terminase small subunit
MRKPPAESPVAPAPTFKTAEARRLFDDVRAQWELDVRHLELLRQACDTVDRIAECKALVDRDGPIMVDRWGQAKPSPAALLERDLRGLLGRLLRELGLAEVEPDSRPPRLAGRYR